MFVNVLMIAINALFQRMLFGMRFGKYKNIFGKTTLPGNHSYKKWKNDSERVSPRLIYKDVHRFHFIEM